MSVYHKCENSVDWDYFDRFKVLEYEDKGGYLPDSGEGTTLATQIATAVCKIVYKWYNDGDVYDNTYHLEGWCNDLSDFANWLSRNALGAADILDRIEDCRTEGDYESEVLKPLADLFGSEELMAKLNKIPATGSVYDCKGPFEFVIRDEEDEWEEDEWDDCEDEECEEADC